MLAKQQLTDVHGMEPIDVFPIIDRAENLVLVDLFRQRRLHKDAVHGGIGVELCDKLEQLGLRRRFGEHDGIRANAEFAGFLALHADVGLRGRVFADANKGDAGRRPAGSGECLNARLGLGVDLRGNRLAIDELGLGHGPQLSHISGMFQARWNAALALDSWTL